MHLLFVLAIAFVSVVLVELPDKTLVATLVLTSRYRRAPVLVGVAAAFAIQCVIAVTAGGLLHRLSPRIVDAAVAALFGVGAAVLLRQGFGPEPAAEETAATDATTSSARIVAIAFGVLFAAEWGDASQLATAALAARYGNPLAVGAGAFAALMSVAVLASALSSLILMRIDVKWIHRVAGCLFGVLALVAVADLLRS